MLIYFYSSRPKRKSDEVVGETTNGDGDVKTEEADVEEVNSQDMFDSITRCHLSCYINYLHLKVREEKRLKTESDDQ